MNNSKFTLTYNEKRRLHYHAYRAQQKDQSEVCGVVFIDSYRKIRIQFLQNLCTSPGSFEILTRDVSIARRQATGQGMRFVGIFHSHVVGEAIPSPRDIREACFSHLQLIYDVCGLEARMWKIRKLAGEKAPVKVSLTVESRRKKRTSH